MNRILQRFRELDNFEKRVFILNKRQHLVSLKPLTLDQTIFFLEQYEELAASSSEKDLFEFFQEIFVFESDDDAEILLNDSETLDSLFDWFFKKYLFVSDFKTLYEKTFFSAEAFLSNDLLPFNKLLVEFGYKIIELEKLTPKKIIKLALTELMLRDYERFVFFNDAFSKKIGSTLVQKEINDLKKEKEKVQAKHGAPQNQKSDFDMLASL